MASGGYTYKNTAGAMIGTAHMQLIEELSIGSSVTTADLATVLDGNTDGGYSLIGYIVSDATVAPTYTIRLNGADWAVNRSNIIVTGAAAYTGAYNTTATILGLQANSGTIKKGYFNLFMPIMRSGYDRVAWGLASKMNNTTTTVEHSQFTYNITTPSSATNITSIGLSASQTNGIGAGSKFKLYKLNN